MSDQTSTPMADAPAAAAAAPARKVRPLYWSVRRELWENRSVYLAPLTAGGLALLGFFFSCWKLARNVLRADAARAASLAQPGDAALAKTAHGYAAILNQPYEFVTGIVFLTALVVAIFYCLGSLYAERRDRSILFWKSLPVSDLTTVLSKAVLPFVATPLVMFAVMFAAHLIMLAVSSVVLLANGISPQALFAYLDFPFEWLGMARGLLVMFLWYAPIFAWLMLVSGWARRVAILWAMGPWAAICIFELLAFHTTHAWFFVRHRLVGGMDLGFTVEGPAGRTPIHTLAQLDLVPILTSPEVLGGLVVAVLLLAAAVRLRRYRDPI